MDILDSIQFLASAPHQCNYLPQKQATSVFADPQTPITAEIYSLLAEIGFRRSGEFVYTPNCPACMACLPVRIPVNIFSASRSQKRNLNKNKGIFVNKVDALVNERHFELFRKYVNKRHADGGMDNPTQSSFLDFIASSWSKTNLYEFYLDNGLIAVAVVDEVNQGLSAVYSFFDPDYSHLSLGTFVILWLIEETQRLNLDWLYLGYFIKDCQKMSYKSSYQPLEAYIQGKWIDYSP